MIRAGTATVFHTPAPPHTFVWSAARVSARVPLPERGGPCPLQQPRAHGLRAASYAQHGAATPPERGGSVGEGEGVCAY